VPAGPAQDPALSGRLGHWVLRRRLLRLMPIKLVCLNLNRSNTWQQPDPAYRPASRVNKNHKDISVCTLFNNVCTFHEIYVDIVHRTSAIHTLTYMYVNKK
jgi:hypothetical protein